MTGILKVDTIQSSGGTTGLTIDSSGRVLTPARPAFSAYRNASLNIQTSRTTIVFDTVQNNQGSHYDTSTGIFTAPVAGLYFFSAAVSIGPGITESRYFNVDLFHNNSTAVLTGRSNANNTTGSTYAGVSVSGVVEMAANDTMRARAEATTSQAMYVADRAVYFTGHLIG